MDFIISHMCYYPALVNPERSFTIMILIVSLQRIAMEKFTQPLLLQQVLVKNHFAGLNFIDTYVRQGIMKLVQPGGILGFEGAGTVEKLGSGVQGLSVGDRVAFGFIGSSK